MTALKIKCKCGRNETLSEAEADALSWSEEGKVKCRCGKAIPFKGHGKINNYGAAWVTEQQ